MITFEDVMLTRSGRVILDLVTLKVNANEHYALLGPNGAGKSTLISVIAGEFYPSTGRVNVLGTEFGAGNIKKMREEIATVSQRLLESLPATATAAEVVLTGKHNVLAPWWDDFSNVDRETALEALDRVGCKYLADKLFGYCSQGERQRILIARSILMNHQLFLFDEPAVGLDFQAREQLMSTIDRLIKTKSILASIYVAHYLEELPTAITHAVLLKNGKIEANGPVRDVLTGENLTNLYDMPIVVVENNGRWSAHLERD